MNESFDPYLKWLGIRDPERPPNHYRLLGIDVLESDPDVIATAADRQMAHVRRYQSGSHARASQDLLNELAAAKLLLLSPEKKAVYDRTLQQTAPQEAAHKRRVVRWPIIAAAAIGICALSVVIAERDTGEPTIEIADAVDGAAQTGIVVHDEPPVENGEADDQGDDADQPTFDHGTAQPMLPAVPVEDLSRGDSHAEREESMAPNRQTPAPAHGLPPWETEIVEIRPFEVHETGTILDDIRLAIAAGDFEEARRELAAASEELPSDDWRLKGLAQTTKALEDFELAVLHALRGGAPAGTHLYYGSSTVVVESANAAKVVLKAPNGDVKEYDASPSKLPALLATALAEHVLPEGDGRRDLLLGAFWAFDERGNQYEAEKYLESARRLGVDVDLMLESWQAPGSGITKVRTADRTGRLSVPKKNDFDRAWRQVKTELSLPARITTDAQKFKAASTLITYVAGERDAVKRYVGLDRAVHYATQADNPALALKALDEIVAKYDVDALKTRRAGLEKLRSTTDPGRAAQVAQAALQALEESIEQDDFAHARRFLAIATSTSKRSRDPKLVNRAEELRLRLKQRFAGR